MCKKNNIWLLLYDSASLNKITPLPKKWGWPESWREWPALLVGVKLHTHYVRVIWESITSSIVWAKCRRFARSRLQGEMQGRLKLTYTRHFRSKIDWNWHAIVACHMQMQGKAWDACRKKLTYKGFDIIWHTFNQFWNFWVIFIIFLCNEMNLGIFNWIRLIIGNSDNLL